MTYDRSFHLKPAALNARLQVTGFFQQRPSTSESFSATVKEAEETQEAHQRRLQYGVRILCWLAQKPLKVCVTYAVTRFLVAVAESVEQAGNAPMMWLCTLVWPLLAKGMCANQPGHHTEPARCSCKHQQRHIC